MPCASCHRDPSAPVPSSPAPRKYFSLKSGLSDQAPPRCWSSLSSSFSKSWWRAFFLAPLHPAKADVAQVLDPFEIGHRHTAGVGVHVRDDHGALVPQNLVGTGGDRPVGRLDDQRRFDPVGVAKVDDALQRGGDQDITFLFQHSAPSAV